MTGRGVLVAGAGVATAGAVLIFASLAWRGGISAVAAAEGTGAIAILVGVALMVPPLRARQVREDALNRQGAALTAAAGRAETKAAQLEATLAGMSDGVMMVDAGLRLLQWNDLFPELSGVPRAMLRAGVTMEEMVRAQAEAGEFGAVDVEAEVRRRMARIRAGGDIGVTERVRPDGRVVELRRRALAGGGAVTLYSDITPRKQAEAAVAQKAQFIAMVSHEIREPVNAVIGSLLLLAESGLSAAQRPLVDTARRAGEALIELVDDILDLTRMEAGRLELRPGAFLLRPLLEEVCAMFAAPAAARGIEFAICVAPDVPAQLYADAGRLRQVLTNFVSNATRYSRPGRVTLLATLIPDEEGRRLRLAVRDQGPHIPADQAMRLFQPFARLNGAGASGTGLGLAICARLAELMEGQVGLDTAPAQGKAGGNEFWITLSPEAVPPGAVPAIPAEPLAGLRPARSRHVLLVEDIASSRELTAALLRRAGHRVDLARSRDEALRLAAEQAYDIVLMDVAIPGINGSEITRRIRALPEPHGRVPVAALTGSDPRDDGAAGMDFVLTRPIRPDALLGLLDRLTPLPPMPPAELLDHARLAELRRGLPPGVFLSLTQQCLNELDERAGALRTALDSGEITTVAAAAHALAGMAGSYGLAAVERRMRALMRGAQAGDGTTIVVASEGLQLELDESMAALRRLLGDAP
jgi:signal transduction histidine kinase